MRTFGESRKNRVSGGFHTRRENNSGPRATALLWKTLLIACTNRLFPDQKPRPSFESKDEEPWITELALKEKLTDEQVANIFVNTSFDTVEQGWPGVPFECRSRVRYITPFES